MRILYIGSSAGTSFTRYKVLAALGHEARIIDPYKALPSSALVRSWSFRTGAWGLESQVSRHVLRELGTERQDLILVDNGELVGARLMGHLREHTTNIANINYDNPYCGRDGGRWRLFRKALPHYDVIFTCRDTSVSAAPAWGAQQVERIWHTVDDALIDAANHPSAEEQAPYRAQVAFIGTWMPERGPFLVSLIEQGVPIRIFGPRWNKAPEYDRLKAHVSLGSLNTRQYEAAVAAADISIGLMSKGNLDLSTRRSMEIPILGGVLCGERTPDHLRLYRDGEEAVFFDTPAECANLCLSLLANSSRLAAIRAAGRRRNIVNGHFHRRLMERVVRTAAERRVD